MDTHTDMWYFTIKWIHTWNDFLDNCLVYIENFNLKVNKVLQLKEDEHIL